MEDVRETLYPGVDRQRPIVIAIYMYIYRVKSLQNNPPLKKLNHGEKTIFDFDVRVTV